MNHQTSFAKSHAVREIVRSLALAAVLTAGLAHADEYGEINQLVRSGKLAEAMKRTDQYLATKPRDPQARFLKGVIQSESGKPGDAIATFLKLTEDYPELPEPYNNLAVLYAGQNQFDLARAALEMAIRTNPSYATAHENLGDVYARLASQAYSKALQLDGNNTGVQPKLALIRELFAPGAKGVRPTITAAAPAKAASASPVTTPVATAIKAPASAPLAAASAAPAGTPTKAPPVASAGDPGKDVEAAVRAWAAAWASKDMNGYLAAYGQDFDPPGKQSRKTWEEDRRARILGKSKITVNLANLSISVKGDKATARFRQEYRADSLNVNSRKTLELVKSGDRWVIVKESTGA